MPEENTITETIGTVFCDVLEHLAFMFGDRVDKEEISSQSGDFVEGRIDFKGPKHGELRFMALDRIAADLAANILGIDPDAARASEDSEDTLKELMNVTVGQLLTAICRTEAVFNVGVPRLVTGLDAGAWSAFLKADDTTAFVVDEHPVLLRLEMTS